MSHLINIFNLKKKKKGKRRPRVAKFPVRVSFHIHVAGILLCSSALLAAVEILMMLSYANGVLYKENK